MLRDIVLLWDWFVKRARVNVQYESCTTDSPRIVVDRSKLILIVRFLLETAAQQELEHPFLLTIRIIEDNESLCLYMVPFIDEWPFSVSDEDERVALSEFLTSLNIQIERPDSEVLLLRFPKSEDQ